MVKLVPKVVIPGIYKAAWVLYKSIRETSPWQCGLTEARSKRPKALQYNERGHQTARTSYHPQTGFLFLGLKKGIGTDESINIYQNGSPVSYVCGTLRMPISIFLRLRRRPCREDAFGEENRKNTCCSSSGSARGVLRLTRFIYTSVNKSGFNCMCIT